jgi:hypothetical protein
MIPRDVFYDRLDNHCRHCEHWANVCLLGHQSSSPEGCPDKRFPPIQGAQYAVVHVAPPPPALGNCCGNTKEELKPLTWPQVLAHFAESMVKWVAEGLPLASREAHALRYGECKSNRCGEFKGFYCRHCRCVAYTKAKLATETCPKGMWHQA